MYIISCIFTVICAIVLPITLAVIFSVRKPESWKPILFGALTYVFFRVLICTSILQMAIPQISWFNTMSAAQPDLYALIKACIAALFEEGGGFLVILLFLKKQRSILDGIAFGVGHGGIEAITIAAINIAVLMLSSSELSVSSTIFAGGLERLSTLAIQIALSVMLMKSVREKKYLWLLMAFLIHTAVDFGTVLASQNSVDTWAIELALAAVAIAMALFVLKEYKKGNPDPDMTKRL
jgi:uncharacterized membrane protein YhfC